MFCRKCGSPLNEGEKFCSVCGEKVESGVPVQQSLEQQPYGQQPLDQQAYGQQPYGQQPYGNTYYNEPKKSLKWLWITLSLVAVLAIAAVLIFVVLPGSKQAAISENPWPFKGDTTQTQFVNNTVKVFSDAFDGFGNENSGLKKIVKQPFDLNMDIDMNIMGQSVGAKIDAAYDEESLGLNLGAMGQSIKILLLEDVLYVDSLGSVAGLKFNSTADLTKPMPLEDRIKALAEGLSMQQSTLTEDDIIAIFELFVNSIDEKCFENSDSKSTLTLHADDIVKTLRVFAQKLDANDDLKTKLESSIEGSGSEPVDIVVEINNAADMLDEQKDSVDFELVWEVTYENQRPVSFVITVNAEGQKIAAEFGYEQNGDSTDITFNVDTGDPYMGDISGEFSYKKTAKGIEFEGSVTAQGQTYAISGDEVQDGDNAEGTITLSIPGVGDMSIDYSSEIKIGMPAKSVKDDSRFQVDTDNAVVTDMDSLSGLPSVY